MTAVSAPLTRGRVEARPVSAVAAPHTRVRRRAAARAWCPADPARRLAARCAATSPRVSRGRPDSVEALLRLDEPVEG